MAGEAVRLLGGFGRRYAVAVRVATLPPIAAIALLRASPDAVAGTALAVAVAVGWTCGYGWRLRRDGAGVAVAAAERAEERELANSLHDAAATTLLMVGVGQVPPGAAWLVGQARRDLTRLRSAGERVPERADLVDALRADLDAGHLTTELDAPEHLPLPFDVAAAISGAVREALNNVRRHAGTDRAVVRVRGGPAALRVEVVDEGGGFDGEPGPTRRGLRESVYGRMIRIGGAATVTSAAGAGTVVALEWRADE